MSNQNNDFDQIFRDRLSDQMATPPPAVWENIQAKRTFGHVVANRISNNWRIFGTLLMLLLAGGSSILLFGEEETNHYAYRQSDMTQQEINKTITIQEPQDKLEGSQYINVNKQNNPVTAEKAKARKNKVQNDEFDNFSDYYPSADELASLAKAGFVRPELPNSKLSVYIETLEGWESAKPKAFTRYYYMDEMEKRFINTKLVEANPKKVAIDYDYVLPAVERKTFWQRSSFVIALTPQTIHKTMRAKYNLSSSYLRDREKAESVRLAYSVSGLLQYELTKNRFIETGINYTQIYEEMFYEGQRRFSNQYNFVEVPLLLGFQNRNARWGWHVKGGLGLQIMSSYKGYILKRVDVFGEAEPEPLTRMKKGTVRNYVYQNHNLSSRQSRNELADLENEAENPFKTRGVVNVHLAAGITYFYTEKTSFLLTPSFSRSINSITKQEVRFTEKLQYVGISFGTRFKF